MAIKTGDNVRVLSKMAEVPYGFEGVVSGVSGKGDETEYSLKGVKESFGADELELLPKYRVGQAVVVSADDSQLPFGAVAKITYVGFHGGQHNYELNYNGQAFYESELQAVDEYLKEVA
jgi:uncharacterized protein YecE (DUF72 family)